ncbi:protein IQ-DOMAIN 32 [Sesamum indicum]|uniref:Protein IQ-DOMAIN 32 n=1 Tax=Sesamum indicum TaxID=4182 RepID=A0A6I9TQR0_SESIN|nr:protein IQ-DOMAIN 32 [Sesamum indicum]
MGKPTASCFKIIACGSDSVDHDDLQTSESKGSSDRRGWSFRKRSARHRVLSNSVISEAPSSANKENPDSTAVDFHVQPDLTAPEKTPAVQLVEEKTELSTQLSSKLSDTIPDKEDDCGAYATVDESSVIIIQAAIRGLLAQRVLLRQKNVIKLQAAVRGHLVRSYAVGTLRCVQAIVKMQALVRARRARLLGEGSGDLVKQSETIGKDNNDLITPLSKKEAKTNGTYAYISIEKLLGNAFARQLMESTPRSKPINIKCDPLRSDSAWKWLERWMSVSSVSNEEPQGSGSAIEQHNENIGHSDAKEEILAPSDCYTESTDFKFGVGESAEASQDDDSLINHDANNLDLDSCKSISPSSSHSKLHNIDQSNEKLDETESVLVEIEDTDLIEKVEVESLSEKEETGSERDLPDMKKNSTEQPDTEAKKFSRKASNPAFIAAQSKFEELSSAGAPAKLSISSSHDPGVESSLENVSSSNDQPLRSIDIGLADNAISNASAIQIGGSECGTELSISSTLDSPDRSEAGVNDIEQETKVPDETDHHRSGDNLEVEADGKSITLETDPSYTTTNELERNESIASAAAESLSTIAADPHQLENKPETDPRDLQLELESEASHMVNKSSPEASPRSHITVPESQATPSSQASVKPKKNKGAKSDTNRKNRPSSVDKKTLSSRNQDSASRSSLEQLQEHKSGKRRNSFGSAKPDQREQEPRDSSSSNSLPSYMQATESARAKAIANGSPRSSPDVHEKDVYLKKRHSLPGTNERQGSPRIQRSLSQAQPNAAKGNGTHSPQERKWRR